MSTLTYGIFDMSELKVRHIADIDETRNQQEPKKPFPVPWLNGYDGLVPYEDYPEHDVQFGSIDKEANK